jgi:hypothetical protein
VIGAVPGVLSFQLLDERAAPGRFIWCVFAAESQQASDSLHDAATLLSALSASPAQGAQVFVFKTGYVQRLQ